MREHQEESVTTGDLVDLNVKMRDLRELMAAEYMSKTHQLKFMGLGDSMTLSSVDPITIDRLQHNVQAENAEQAKAFKTIKDHLCSIGLIDVDTSTERIVGIAIALMQCNDPPISTTKED